MAQPVPQITYEEYLAQEAVSATKHEYLAGAVYAMAGGTPEHARLQANVIIALGAALRGRPCAVYSSDLRVRIDATDRTTYPDVSVVCGAMETSRIDPHAVTNPTLLVEVTSESTEADDRGDKFAHYRHIPSLREYVVVSGKSQRIEVYRRNDRDKWELGSEGTPGESVQLTSVDVRVDVAEIYANPLAATMGTPG
jgi:Uma2 family endonuclease